MSVAKKRNGSRWRQRELSAESHGHLQRGGPPTTLDRILGTRFGVHAVELIAEGRLGEMVSYQNYEVASVLIAEAVDRIKLVQPGSQMVLTARAVGISFGD